MLSSTCVLLEVPRLPNYQIIFNTETSISTIGLARFGLEYLKYLENKFYNFFNIFYLVIEMA